MFLTKTFFSLQFVGRLRSVQCQPFLFWQGLNVRLLSLGVGRLGGPGDDGSGPTGVQTVPHV